MQSLVVFSHLRWDFVYQRPQHLMTRLAGRWPVLFIEEPVPQSSEDRLETKQVAPGVQVWRPHLRTAGPGFHEAHKLGLQQLLAQALTDQAITDYWVWFYTPMALPTADILSPNGMVYDCMDELSAFRGAPPELLELEAALLRQADVVFTGGRSLYTAKRHRHHNIHCFPSSVDARHFAPAKPANALQEFIPGPRLGYAGVIDERIDLDLVAGMADKRPGWQFVMVGPTAKIDPSSLPNRPNIHWLGQQPYADLPGLINGWDVCLMPFALNESTRFISPTKTLEYLACGKPTVSTAIQDVVSTYGELVPIREDARGFVAACDAIIARTPVQRALYSAKFSSFVSQTSWDAVARAMTDVILEVEEQLDTQRAAARTSRAALLRPAAKERGQALATSPAGGLAR